MDLKEEGVEVEAQLPQVDLELFLKDLLVQEPLYNKNQMHPHILWD